MPALVMAGDLDAENVMISADLLAERLPNAQKRINTGAAHLQSMEKPEEFNQVVMGFLDSIMADK
jgi:3-oxoadipate enol-lactonase